MTDPTKVSFIIPSRNTIDYLKLAYASIRRWYPTNEIVILDESDSDLSWEWVESINDPNLIKWKNRTGKLLGHTITYDHGVRLSTNPIFSIFHSDMVCSRNYVENLLKWWKPSTVVCSTRVEPEGIYGPGKEKILKPFGAYNTDFNQVAFDEFIGTEQTTSSGKTTRGIFAPWLMSKADFESIGGHDAIFSPYPTEDSDIFIRFALAGYDLIQSRDSLCYHFISKGHRNWAKNGIGHDDSDFKFYLRRSVRNYLRKWNQMFSYDEFHHPIIHPVFDIAIVVTGVRTPHILAIVEPWAQKIYCDNTSAIESYIREEQPTTCVPLSDRVRPIGELASSNHNVVLSFTEEDFSTNDPDYNKVVIEHINEIIVENYTPDATQRSGIFELKTRGPLVDISKNFVRVTNPKIDL